MTKMDCVAITIASLSMIRDLSEPMHRPSRQPTTIRDDMVPGGSMSRYGRRTAAFRLGGDFVECGVYRGFVSSAIMDYLDWNVTCGARRFFLFDTFDGFVHEQLDTDEQGRFAEFGDKYKSTYESTAKAFSETRNLNIVKGAVPESLTTQNIASVSYLHLDMNCAAPEIAALEHFWPKLLTGALVLMDDYAYRGYGPQYVALNSFAEKVGYRILSLPTGQVCLSSETAFVKVICRLFRDLIFLTTFGHWPISSDIAAQANVGFQGERGQREESVDAPRFPTAPKRGQKRLMGDVVLTHLPSPFHWRQR